MNKKSLSNISEKELWIIYKNTKDIQVKDFLIEKYIPLVRYIANKIKINLPAYIEFEDLVSYGYFGLIKSVERFNPDKRVKFKTYAYMRIRGAIFDACKPIILEYKRMPILSLDEMRVIDTGDGFESIKGYIGTPSEMNPAIIMEKKEVKEQLIKFVDELPEIERRVIVLHYYKNIDNFAEIGRLMNISREGIRQIHNRAIAKLKKRIKEYWS